MNINLRKLPILLIIFSLTCLTNEITLGSENRGFDKKKLSKVDKKVQQLIDEKFIAGAITLVARDGNCLIYTSDAAD